VQVFLLDLLVRLLLRSLASASPSVTTLTGLLLCRVLSIICQLPQRGLSATDAVRLVTTAAPHFYYSLLVTAYLCLRVPAAYS